jgi:hypothetical protein
VFTNPNDSIWFGNGVFKTKNEDDIKNISRSSLSQPTLGAQIFKGWFLMTLEIILSLMLMGGYADGQECSDPVSAEIHNKSWCIQDPPNIS